VLACLGCTLAIVLLRDIDYDLFHRNIFRVYPLVAYGAAAIWLGLGARAAVQWADHVFRGAAEKNLLAAALAVLLVGTTWVGGAGANFRAHDDWSAAYAGVLLHSLPQRAVLYANADTVNGPVGYLHWIEGARPDIRLYSGWYLVVEDQPYRPYMLPPAELEALRRRRDVRGLALLATPLPAQQTSFGSQSQQPQPCVQYPGGPPCPPAPATASDFQRGGVPTIRTPQPTPQPALET